MPTVESILGFSNRWYEAAMNTSVNVDLTADVSIRLVAPPYFLATKLEAFLSRGKADYLESHDLEDVLSVIDGRPEIIAEVACAAIELQKFVAEVFDPLLADDSFVDRLPGLLLDGSPAERTNIVLQRLITLSGKK